MAGFDTNTNMMDGTGVNIPAVQQALDSSSDSAITLCTDSQRIQRMSRRKPFHSTALAYATESALDAALASANYGWSIPSGNSPSVLINSSGFSAKNWTWNLPGNNGRKRLGDFRGYYKFPQDPIIACTYPDATIVVDLLQDTNFIVPFYIYQKTGKLKERGPNVATGMGPAPSQSKLPNQLRGSLAFDALDYEGALKPNDTIGNIYNPNLSTQSVIYRPYFGLAIFQSDRTFVGFLPCAKKTTVGNTETWVPVPLQVVPDNATYDIEMYQLSSDLIKISGLAGQYKAVPCVAIGTGLTNITPASSGTGHVFAGDPEQGTTGGNDQSSATLHYMSIPTYQDNTFNFRNLFNLNVGSLDFYPYTVAGITESETDSTPRQILTTSAPQCYIHITLRNNSGKSVYFDDAKLAKVKLRVTVNRTVTAQGQPITSSETITSSVRSISSRTLSANGTVTLKFQSPPLWNSGSAITIDSGTAEMNIGGDNPVGYLFFDSMTTKFPSSSAAATGLSAIYQAP